MRKSYITLITLLIVNHLQANWEQVSVTDSIGSVANLTSIHFINDSVGYLTGRADSTGQIFKTRDSGTTWTRQNSTTTNDLHSVYFISEDYGFAGGEYNTLLRTVDGGVTWKEQDQNFSYHSKFKFISPKAGFYVERKNVHMTLDSGLTWTMTHAGEGNTYLNSIYFSSDLIGYAVGWSGTVAKTIDGGYNWIYQTPITTRKLNDVLFTNDSIGWAVGDSRTLIHTTDGGENWQKITVPQASSSEPLYSIRIKDGEIFILGYRGLYTSKDNGAMWSKVTLLGGRANSSLNLLTSNSVFFLNSSSSIVRYDEPFVTSSEDVLNKNEVSIYPNPTSNNLTISFNEQVFENLRSIKILNSLGIEVYKGNVNSLTQQVDVSQWSEGMYILYVENGDSSVLVRKFIVNK